MTIDTLYNLVNQFTPQERLLIRYALKGSRDEQNKSLLLFDFVLAQGKKVSRSAASVEIYKAPPDTRINKLISRLWERVLEIMTSESFLGKTDRLTEQAKIRLDVRKKVFQCSTLMFLNGNSTTTKLLIDEGIEDARKCESVLMLIDLYRLKKNAAMFYGNRKEYDFCAAQIAYYERSYAVEQKILFYHNELIQADGYGNSLSPKETLKSLNKILNELKKENKYINITHSKKLFALLQIKKQLLEENYAAARKIIRQINKSLSTSFMAGGRSQVVANMEFEFSICDLFTGNYNQAIRRMEKCLALIWANNKTNYFLTLESFFQALFFNKEFGRAEKILSEFQSEGNPIKNEFRIAKIYYLQAHIHFHKREYLAALKILNQSMPLNKDKTAFDIGIRILRIQCLLVLERFDEASTQIENLRKHVSRNSETCYTTQRNVLITRALVMMQKRGFTGKPNKTESDLIKKLSSPTGEYKWKPLTPELIRFHEWYAELA